MSKKRTSTESSNDEQTNEDSDAFRQVDNDKRGKLASFSDTTLHDIPTEIRQCILIKAITMEGKNMKLVKSVWKEKADLVISRLGSVCSQWSSVLTTDFFRIELHRALDGIAEVKIRMEIIQELSVVGCFDYGIDTLKDDLFLFCRRNDSDNPDCSITVYDRNNMAEVKDVIEIPGVLEGDIAACNVSNCIYILSRNFASRNASILRITKDDKQKFNIQSWITPTDLSWCFDSISVSDEGRIIVPSSTVDEHHKIDVYNPNGLLQHEVILSLDVYGLDYIEKCTIMKSNGNFVLGSVEQCQLDHEYYKMVLTEIDMHGIIKRKYTSPLDPVNDLTFMCFADAFGRILIRDTSDVIELLDAELNLLELTYPQSNNHDFFFNGLHYDSQRNEVIGLIRSYDTDACLIKIFRFIEE